MKAITIWQPWASLLACGAKQYETRSWATSYRGPIAIHAATRRMPSKDYFGGGFEGDVSNHLRHLFYRFDMSPRDEFRWIMDNLDYGAVIATAELVECWEIEKSWRGGRSEGYVIDLQKSGRESQRIYHADTEVLFGDWTPGRYAWEFANMTMLETPIPAKGGQRIWNWEE